MEVWPELKYAEWGDCCSTLQMWLQIVGKIRMELTPALNQCWNVTLYPTARGLTTMPMWCGARTLQIDFDFIDHELVVQTSSGGRGKIALAPMTVAEFYKRLLLVLNAMETPVKIWPHPVEVAEPIPFEEDKTHRTYDPEHVRRFWQILLQTTRVFEVFRARFTGKVSPVHLFWGAMDLACTRFSGRVAPEHASMPGLPDRVVRDAYSHEVSSVGFWPGGPGVDAFFYSYAYPEPKGYREWKVQPSEGRFDATFGEFVLPYAAVRAAKDPVSMLLEFLQSTYEAAADLGKWDRKALEVKG